MALVDPAAVSMGLSGRDVILFRMTASGKPEEGMPDGVYTRMGGSAPREALRVLRLLELAGVFCVNGSASLELGRDKAASSALFARNRIPHPRSAFVSSEGEMESAVSALRGPPWVVKIPVSAGGSGVSLAESWRSLRSVRDMLAALGHGILIQEFVSDAKGADTRVLVVGGEVMGSMRRQGRADDFRSNVHKGGSFSAVKITREMEELALKTADVVGLKIVGVDIVEGREGPLVVEVNGSPGFEAVSTAVGRDMAEIALDFFLNDLKKEKGERGRDKSGRPNEHEKTDE